ncbi:MAG: topoisomerase C-terminal repeat-containing protein, partial [Pseudomonadota bacterium]
IWKRTIASQMEAARLERTTVEIANSAGSVGLRATGQVVLFDGFLRVYEEGRDDIESDDDRRLPQIAQGDAAPLVPGFGAAFEKAGGESDVLEGGADDLVQITDAAVMSQDTGAIALQSHTQPPPRYTEATLVKRMEELGIGRPSTYASIVTTIQDRDYVRKDKGRLFPEDKGRLVTAFLSNFFRRYVEYEFTADLEEELDDVSAGSRAYKDVLDRFWADFKVAIDDAMDRSITEVLEKINEELEPHLFPALEDGGDPRQCPNCGVGRLSMRTARAGGAFIGCSRYPECRYTRPFGPPDPEAEASAIPPDGKLLGVDAGDEIRVFKGRFGPYVQRGAATTETPKPPRQSIPKDWVPEELALERALMLLSLPREVGPHPEDGVMVWANIGRYGPYLKHAPSTSDRGGTNANLESNDEVWTVGMNRAVQLLAEKVASRGARGRAAPPLRDLGEHPHQGGPVTIMNGKYGPYVKWDKVNATIPDTVETDAVTMDMALQLIEERAAKAGKAKRKAPAKSKTTAKKTAAAAKNK